MRIAVYMLENSSTVRKAGAVFGVSKSTVHKDLTVRLRALDKPLFNEVAKLMNINKQERHIRGGMATKLKYQREKKIVDKS